MGNCNEKKPLRRRKYNEKNTIKINDPEKKLPWKKWPFEKIVMGNLSLLEIADI